MAADESKTVIRPNTENYVTTRSASGAKTQTNGDEVATGLAGLTLDETKEVASAMGVEDVNKYDHLNVGQRRMCLGNRIRGAIAKGNKEKDGAGDTSFAKVVKPYRAAADKREKEAEKERAAKAKAAEKAKAA